MALTKTVAAATPSRFMAVPTRVWSALKLTAATARSREKRTPRAIEARMTRSTRRRAGGGVSPVGLPRAAMPRKNSRIMSRMSFQ